MELEIVEEMIQKLRQLKLDKIRAQLEEDLDFDIESEARLRFVYVREFINMCLERK